MYLVQLWAIPGIADLSSPMIIKSELEVALKCVKIERDYKEAVYATLLEAVVDRPEIQMCAQHDIPKLGQVLTRLSFSLLVQFHAISARIIKTEPDQGDIYEESNCAGAPAGVSLYEYKVGFAQHTNLDSTFLLGNLPENVDSAISWFLIGNSAINSLQQIMCHWIGLEMLASEIKGPYRCRKCGKDVKTCPHCGKTTYEPKSVTTIRSYLVDTLGISKDKFIKYYELRNKISHGKLEFSGTGLLETSGPALEIQQLLLRAIKKEIGWPQDALPKIDFEGLTIIGQPWLTGTGTYKKDHNFDYPACLPF